VKRGEGDTNSPELSLLKFLPLAYNHSHFLAATLISHLFSQQHSWGPHPFFTAGLFWIKYNFTLLFLANLLLTRLVSIAKCGENHA